MSHNAEVVRALYDEWVRGDFGSREPFAEDLDFELRGSLWPDRAKAHGIDGMAAAWRSMLQAWDHFETGPIEDLVEADDTVVVFNRVGGQGRISGARVDALAAAVFTFRGGKISRLVLTYPAEARRVADLPD
jgi:ketosteroid isomerase-like protein